MALGIVEIVEDDCGTDECIEFIVFSEKHAKSIVGKNYKDPTKIMEWEVLDLPTAKSLINSKILLRSPMTCQTPNFKVCQKCFGARQFPTKQVGVMSGQIVSERLTQLIMRSFHSSGSANLKINNEVKQFIQNHLTNITHNEGLKQYIIEFNSTDIPDKINEIVGFKESIENLAYFEYYTGEVPNIDAIEVMNNVKEILKTNNKVKKHPVTYYEEIMAHMLEVGTPYSSFIEILLSNMFLSDADPDNKKFWRYNTGQPAVKKFGEKNLALNISPTLGCLFQPNKTTLQSIDSFSNGNVQNMSIHERIWMGHWQTNS